MSDADSTSGAVEPTGAFLALRTMAGVTVGVTWAGFMFVLVALGSCEAFGGRCDGTSPPVFEDDVAGGAFVGTAAAVWVLWWLRRPSTRQAVVGVPVAFVAAVIVAFIARDIAHG